MESFIIPYDIDGMYRHFTQSFEPNFKTLKYIMTYSKFLRLKSFIITWSIIIYINKSIFNHFYTVTYID